MKRKTVVTILSTAMLLAIASIWVARRADAIIIIGGGKGRDTGMFGIAANQTARTHVLNATDASGQPCIVEVRFFDALGRLLLREGKKVMPGQAEFVDFPAPDLRAGQRLHLHAVVLQSLPPDFDLPTPMCLTTTEVVDNRTGNGLFIIDDGDQIP